MAVLDLVRTVAPTDTPVSLAEAKAHLRVDADNQDDDALIQGLLDAATDHLDGYAGILGRCLVAQTWALRLSAFPCEIELPLGPLISVTGITYLDPDGATQTLATSVYEVIDGPAPLVVLKHNQSWPSIRSRARSVTVTFVAGWATRASVPSAIKAAILLLIGHWYANREAVAAGPNASELPLGVTALLAPYRTGMIG